MSLTQVEKEKREEKKKEEKKEEKIIRVKKPVLPKPLKKMVFQRIVHFKRVKAFLLIHAPRLKLTELHLPKLTVKPSRRMVSKTIESPRFILSKLLKIRISISKFFVVNSSKLASSIISLIPPIQMKMPQIELSRFKLSRLVQEPKLKSKLMTFPSSKILLNEPVKIQTQPTLSFKMVSKATIETIERIETIPSKEEEMIEEIEAVPLGESEEPEDLFELLFDWEEPDKLEKFRNALMSPTATCVFLIPNVEVFQGELTIRKILANEFKRSYGEIDAKHDASSDLSDRGKNVVTISKDKVEKLAKIIKKPRKRVSYGK
ncbi:MAG: hypothetical protein QMD13_00380 [Candidatus Bathyarchaeia archaeon]|nr:hypothetical protein [Candidatus Bathyarchaeia archaeon]